MTTQSHLYKEDDRLKVPVDSFIHKKSGGRYQLVGQAQLQTDKPLSDMASVSVYRGEDGRLWVRDATEFAERFEAKAAVEPAPAELQRTPTRRPSQRPSIETRVVTVIAEQMGMAESSIKPEHFIVADLGADSLDGVELAMAIEDEFNIEIDEDQLEKVTTVASVFELVSSLVRP